MLEQEHYSVDAAYTGTDGLDSALSGIYDAIILDVMLPGMDGFAILDALRRGGLDVPVLMLTARGSLDDRVRGLNMGADYYLPKPFERSELMACLNAITRRKSAPQVQELSFGDLTLDRETAPPYAGSLECTRERSAVCPQTPQCAGQGEIRMHTSEIKRTSAAERLPMFFAIREKTPPGFPGGAPPQMPCWLNYNLHNRAGGSPKFCFAASNFRRKPGGLQSADSNRHPLLEMWV